MLPSMNAMYGVPQISEERARNLGFEVLKVLEITVIHLQL
jgi:hypothetical protein